MALEKAAAWTEEPAQAAAAVLQVPQAPTAEPEVPAPKAVAKKEQNKMPWEGVTGIKPVTFRLPADLAAKLKYLGGVTYGESINSIAIAGLEREVKRMMKEGGHGKHPETAQED